LNVRTRPTGLDGLVLVESDVHRDERGFVLESYQERPFAEAGITDRFVQDNHSRSKQGVLRGLHYQDLSAPMSKLVRCSNGSILDVAVDLRVGSQTFGKWFAAELSDANLHQLFIPVGFAHGFLALSPWADVEYKCGGYYAPKAEGAIAWNDKDLNISWPIADPIVAPRDASARGLAQYLERPAFHYRP
jgi:dTDP-4-dehydrorhamnose 3,5-epimerase